MPDKSGKNMPLWPPENSGHPEEEYAPEKGQQT
jgi:hypothetical protein